MGETMKDRNYIFEKKDLVEYIKFNYHNQYKTSISPIKLQKSLYFLFAFWGANISKGKRNMDNIEIDVENINTYLFNANFSAWTYGPVDEQIYKYFKNNPSIDENRANNIIKSSNILTKEFVDFYLNKIFITSDFGLVDLTHKDNAWKSHYNSLNTNIDPQEIINEYVEKIS